MFRVSPSYLDRLSEGILKQVKPSQDARSLVSNWGSGFLGFRLSLSLSLSLPLSLSLLVYADAYFLRKNVVFTSVF